MVLEVCLVHHVVHKACGVRNACGIGCRIRAVKGQMELEVRELLLKFGEVLKVEGLDKGTRAGL